MYEFQTQTFNQTFRIPCHVHYEFLSCDYEIVGKILELHTKKNFLLTVFGGNESIVFILISK